MKNILFLCLLAPSVFAQDSLSLWSNPLKLKLFKTATMPQTVTNDKTTAQLYAFEVPPGKAVKLTWVNLTTTWTPVATFEESNATILKTTGWVIGTGQTKFSGGGFLYVSNIATAQIVSLTQTTTFPARFELWSERFPAHTPYMVTITPATGAPYSVTIDPRPRAGVTQDSDFQRGSPSFASQVLPIGVNKITISITGQMAIDKIVLSKPIVTEQ